jgi:hypothetical protein
VVIFFLLLSLAQTPASNTHAIIAVAKTTVVRDLDKTLPAETLEVWLGRIAGESAAIKWATTDCGEQTGKPALDVGRDFPLCVEADVPLTSGRRLYVSLLMGTHARGAGPAPPVFRSADILGPGRNDHRSIRTLADVPAAATGAQTTARPQ